MGNEHEFFHGTTVTFQIGDVISPVTDQGACRATFPDTDVRYAYATSDIAAAWVYAEKRWHTCLDDGPPRVYRVAPLGRHSHDPAWDRAGNSRGVFSGDRRSRHGWRVLAEEPMPVEYGTPQDWA